MADTQTYQAPAFTAKGTSRDKVALPTTLFDGTVHMPAMHQAVKAFLANQRQGNAATKIRKFVTGGNQKPWKQKGTGRARQGSIRAPHWVGGGTIFGPIPRSYAQYVPRQIRALARKSALNARARENAIIIIDAFDFEAPKTKTMQALVERVGGAEKKVLVLTNGANHNVYLSGRNLPNVHVLPYTDVSTYHLLWSDLVLIEQAALTGVDAPDVEAAAPKAKKPAKTATKAKAKSKAANVGKKRTTTPSKKKGK
jgi:large subunit ribosomal protein L4